MSQHTIAQLLHAVRESIQRAEASAPRLDDRDALNRAITHLWYAYDELATVAAESLS